MIDASGGEARTDLRGEVSRSPRSRGPRDREGSFAGNIAWTFAGTASPLLLALWAVPVLVANSGTERLGLLTIIWVAVGYFSLFDLGLGRALTKAVSERRGRAEAGDLHGLISTGLRTMFGVGIAVSGLVAVLTPWLVDSVLRVPGSLRGEVVISFRLLCLALPFVVTSAGLIGALQGYHRFREVVLVRAPLGTLEFVGPAVLSFFTPSLVPATALLVGARVVAWVFLRRRLAEAEGFRGAAPFDRRALGELINFGGWIAVTNLVAPLLVYFDRFFISGILGIGVVAFYTTPYELLTRLKILPEAVCTVLFPAVTSALASDPKLAGSLYARSSRVLILAMIVPIVLAQMFAWEALRWWLGAEFAERSVEVARWIALGVFLNSAARLPLVVLHGIGRSDVTAKLHLAEVAPYVACLVWAIGSYGIVGAAMVWSLRVFADTGALFCLAGRHVPAMRPAVMRSAIEAGAAAILIAGLGYIQPLRYRVLAAGIVAAAAAWAVFREWGGPSVVGDWAARARLRRA
jgi:O-antigen/teichoic acid export membrane protein